MIQERNGAIVIERPVWVWALLVLAALGALWILRPILLPFVAGMAVAFLLDPVADVLERWGLSRLMATVVITACFFLFVLMALVLLLPVLEQQLLVFLDRLPGYVESIRDYFVSFGEQRFAKFLTGTEGDTESALAEMARSTLNWLGRIMQRLLSGGLAFLSLLSLVLVTPIVSFYLLLDWDRMVSRIDELLPRDYAGTIRELAREMNNVLAGFVRGTGSVCLILAIYYAAGLSLIGLDFGLIVGLAAGLVSFIPYVGAALGFLVAGLLAVFQFWPDYGWIIAVFAVFLSGQAIEGNVLTPYLVGGRVRLHPVWVIFALFAFGYLFGFVGMLLAVPLAAAIGVLVRFAIGRYAQSRLYRGTLDVEPKRHDGSSMSDKPED